MGVNSLGNEGMTDTAYNVGTGELLLANASEGVDVASAMGAMNKSESGSGLRDVVRTGSIEKRSGSAKDVEVDPGEVCPKESGSWDVEGQVQEERQAKKPSETWRLVQRLRPLRSFRVTSLRATAVATQACTLRQRSRCIM